MKSSYAIIVILVLAIAGLAAWFAWRPAPEAPAVLSFEDCVAAEYPVMESYPRQCRTPDGRTYAEELTRAQLSEQITYTNASADDIVVESPWPGAVTGKPVTVVGEARGSWYSEAVFPIEIRDRSGVVIGRGTAQAQDQWMTENFVPFRADIAVPEAYIGPATLILRKDNPSGLPENDASVSFPFTIEY